MATRELQIVTLEHQDPLVQLVQVRTSLQDQVKALSLLLLVCMYPLCCYIDDVQACSIGDCYLRRDPYLSSHGVQCLSPCTKHKE